MNTKSLFSSAGLVVIAVALVFAVAIISLLPGWRIDLTEDNLYSLSDGTRNIVASLEHPIELMFFYSDSAIEDLPQIRSYGTRVQELLREIVIASNGRLSMSVIDPEPFSEDEDLATQYGVQAVPVNQGGEAIYFGLVVIQTDADGGGPVVVPVLETMPLIRPDQEQFLEYEFLKLITRVGNPDLPVVGLLTELDIDGGFNPIMGQATPPWMVMDFIRQLYEVRRVDIAADDIDVDIDPSKIRVDTYRASGAGGQHVNRTDSAVRLTYVHTDPDTGEETTLVTQCQNGRSQHQNKDQALKMMQAKVYEVEMQRRNAEKQVQESNKSDIGWGSQIRSYVLDDGRIKDLRTGVESHNTQQVLDGALDQFIEASLKAGL